jgi:hypothetical protein
MQLYRSISILSDDDLGCALIYIDFLEYVGWVECSETQRSKSLFIFQSRINISHVLPFAPRCVGFPSSTQPTEGN